MRHPWKLAGGLLTAGAVLVALSAGDGRQVAAAATGGSAAATITVTGSASVTVVPDEAMVSLGVTAEATDAATAMSIDSQHMTAVLAAVQQAGVPAQDIRTIGLDLQPQYRQAVTAVQGASTTSYVQFLPAKTSGVAAAGTVAVPTQPVYPQIVAFRATNTVQVTVPNTAIVGKVVDSALQAGANQVGGITFSVSTASATSARTAAYQEAVTAAHADAAAIASAAGLQITGVKSISEGGSCCIGPIYAVATSAGSASTPVLAGQQTVQASLNVVYEVS